MLKMCSEKQKVHYLQKRLKRLEFLDYLTFFQEYEKDIEQIKWVRVQSPALYQYQY